jgi:hypothetical protein
MGPKRRASHSPLDCQPRPMPPQTFENVGDEDDRSRPACVAPGAPGSAAVRTCCQLRCGNVARRRFSIFEPRRVAREGTCCSMAASYFPP